MNPAIFVANQLNKYFKSDTLVKVGATTAFLKDEKTKYSFGGKVLYENDAVVLFGGLPKRIEVDGENMLELFQYQHNRLLSGCYVLKQNETCKFSEYYFEYNGKKYYDVEDVELLILDI